MEKTLLNLNIINTKNVKFKSLKKEDFLICIDRLSRFKRPSKKYLRVFKDILFKHLISPQLSKKQIEELSPASLVLLVEFIWNKSVQITYNKKNSFKFSNIIKSFDKIYFKKEDDYTSILMKAKLDIYTILDDVDEKKLNAQNVIILKKIISLNIDSDTDLNNYCQKLREKYLLTFPINKVVIVEGITEEILLPRFSSINKNDFSKNGIYLIGAGGKTKVLSLYSDLKDIIKIPVVILLDNDAKQIYDKINDFIKVKDKIILIQNGEFEDILSVNLLKRAFNNNFYDIEKVTAEDLRTYEKMCNNISDIYKTRGLGEFQKAHFAQIVAGTIKYQTDLSAEIKYIIDEIISS